MKELTKLPKKNLSEIAADSIKEYIFENGLKAGDKLPTEVEFMKTLGVSRSTVREAVKQIQMLGILDVKPGQGAVIKEYDQDVIFSRLSWGIHLNAPESSFRELIEARKVIENGIIPLIINNIDEENINDLENTLVKMQAAKSLKKRHQLDAVFHQILLRSTKNNPVIHMGSIILDLFRRKIETYPRSLPQEMLELTNHEHALIVEACKERDAAKLRQVFEPHLARD